VTALFVAAGRCDLARRRQLRARRSSVLRRGSLFVLVEIALWLAR